MLSLVIHHTCYVKQTQINEQNNSYSMYSLIRCANEYKQMSCSTIGTLISYQHMIEICLVSSDITVISFYFLLYYR